MPDIKDRIKLIRQQKKLNQEAFGEMLGITGASISRYEAGNREIPDSMLQLISRTFSISESWLRTGEGEMEIPAPSDLVEQLARENNLSPAHVALLRAVSRAFAELDEETFTRIMDELLADLQAAAAARSVVVADPSSRQVDPQSPADQPSSSSLPGSVVG